MFSYKIIVIAIAFALLSSIVHCDITVQDGFVPDMGNGGVNDFAIYVVGDLNGYSITALPNHNDEIANATCGHYVDNSQGLAKDGGSLISGQCQTKSENGDQTFLIECINHYHPEKLAKGKGSAIITFTGPDYYNAPERSTAIVTSKNEIWIGYNSSSLIEQPTKLKKSPQPAIEFHGNGVGVLINCHSDKVSPVNP